MFTNCSLPHQSKKLLTVHGLQLQKTTAHGIFDQIMQIRKHYLIRSESF